MAGAGPSALPTAIFGLQPRLAAHWNALGLFYQIPEALLERARGFQMATELGHLLGGWVNGLRGGPAWKRGAKKQPVQDAGLPRFPETPVPFCVPSPAESNGNTSQAATGTSQPATGALLLTI